MSNQKARRHVKKGLFALCIGLGLLFFYEKWQVTGWLGEIDNVVVTILVVIVPLILVTEMSFSLYLFLRDKLHNIHG